jgi:mono/diheme cytochrome c family protein
VLFCKAQHNEAYEYLLLRILYKTGKLKTTTKETIMKTWVKVLLGLAGMLVLLVAGGLIYFSVTFPKVGPAPDIESAGTDAQVERGEYLANHVMVCIDCHSQRDWSIFAGPIVLGTRGAGGEKFAENTGFPGIIYSKNITPAGIGEWTDGEILQAITAGVSKDGTALFPVMPYPAYNIMAESDVKAIIAYLRTMEPIENSVPERQLNPPMNQIVKTMPAPYNPQPKPSASDTIAYGEYLITTAACADCHTPREQGQPIPSMQLAGGRTFVLQNGDTVRSANITPHEITGIGTWSKELFVDRFKYFADTSHQTIALEDTNMATLMPWIQYAGMTREDLGAMYAYLQSIKPIENQVAIYSAAKDRK